MTNSIKHWLTHWREARELRWRLWEVWVDIIMGIYLPIPRRIFLGHQHEAWMTWGKMQTRIISHFRNHWPETHTYLWYWTLEPQWVTDHIEATYFEHVCRKRSIRGSKKDEHVFIFHDFPDGRVPEIVLSLSVLNHYSKAVFVVDHKPEDWRKAVNQLLDVTNELLRGRSIDEFKADLSHCRCLCYLEDEDLVIAKVDLPPNVAKSIIEDVAREENFDLVWHEGRPKWKRKVRKEYLQRKPDFWGI